ncbi:hypothetical protein VTH06DRAFT_4967 [Thermothelomyces fergusii]
MAPKIDITTYPGNIIHGRFVPTPTTRHSIDPATGEPLFEVPVARREDLDAAVAHGRAAFRAWSATAHEERAGLMRAFADAVEANGDELARLQTMEQGKPLGLARTEVGMAVRWLRAFAAMRLDDEVLDDDDERTIYSTRVPLGVVGAIVPWNWPILLGLGKVGPALMTGNVVIVKPSPYTPYCDLKLGELAMAVFPPGVVQVLSGDDSLGPWLTEHPGVDMISFTGSIATGKKVAASCARTLKRYVLELGGNDAAIVCDDVDLDRCLPKIATLAFLNSGQICMLAKRIYVHDKIYDRFRDAMVDFTRKHIKTGGGFEPDVVVGPVQNRMQSAPVLRAPHQPQGHARPDVGQHGQGDQQGLRERRLVDLAGEQQVRLGRGHRPGREGDQGRRGEVEGAEEAEGVGRVALDARHWQDWVEADGDGRDEVEPVVGLPSSGCPCPCGSDGREGSWSALGGSMGVGSSSISDTSVASDALDRNDRLSSMMAGEPRPSQSADG